MIAKRFLASLGHGLLWLALAYVVWGLAVRHRYFNAWNATKVGDSVPTVMSRFGAPDLISLRSGTPIQSSALVRTRSALTLMRSACGTHFPSRRSWAVIYWSSISTTVSALSISQRCSLPSRIESACCLLHAHASRTGNETAEHDNARPRYQNKPCKSVYYRRTGPLPNR
jgi:hypothetical protein